MWSRINFQPINCVNLAKYLKCRVCFDFAVTPIYSCKGAHIICGMCKPKVLKCPSCQDRNFSVMWVLEDILKAEDVHVPCRNKKQGCTMEIEPHLMKDHVANLCDFRPIKCEDGINGCERMYAPNEFFKHLVDCHHSIETEKQPIGPENKVKEFNIRFALHVDFYRDSVRNVDTVTAWNPEYFKFDGNTFICLSRTTGNGLYFWITMLGHEESATKYEYSIAFSSECSKSEKKQVRYDVLPVHCLQHYGFQKVKDSGHFATISFDGLKFLHDKRPEYRLKFDFTISVELSKVKDAQG